MNNKTISNVTNQNNSHKQVNVRFIAVTGMLSALATVLQYIEIPIPMLIPSFIKYDFSDLPALIGAFAFGPVAGVVIELIKNLLHCLVSQSATVGELSNFILGAVFVFTAGTIYKSKKTKKRAIIGGLVGAVLMALVSLPSNYFVVYPFYYNFMSEDAVFGMYKVIAPFVENMLQCLIIFNIPFTFIKGLIAVIVTMFIYKPLSPIIKGRH